MYNFFSMGWVVALACFQGLIQKEGVFLRTPKTKSSSKVLHALQVTRWETGLGLTCLLAGVMALVAHPSPRTLFLGTLLTWQASLYLAAPFYSLMSIRGELLGLWGTQGERRGPSILENRAARLALALALLIGLIAAFIQLLPPPAEPPSYAQYQPADVPPQRLFGLERVPMEQRAIPPTPTPLPTAVPSTETPAIEPTQTNTPSPTPSALPTALPTPTLGATPTLSPTATSTATLTATPIITVTPTSTLTPTAVPPTVTPTLSLTPTLPSTPLPSPTSVQIPTAPPLPPATPIPLPPTDTPVPPATPIGMLPDNPKR